MKKTERVVQQIKRLMDEQALPPDQRARHLSRLLREAKQVLLNEPDFQAPRDPEQMWKAVLGNALEPLVGEVLDQSLQPQGLRCRRFTKKALGRRLYEALKPQITVTLARQPVEPDADLMVYRETPPTAVAVLSVKKKFREKITQVAYWTIKLRAEGRRIKYYMVTLNEDEELRRVKPGKGKLIAWTDLDGVYVLAEEAFRPEANLKDFSQLPDDLLHLAKEMGG